MPHKRAILTYERCSEVVETDQGVKVVVDSKAVPPIDLTLSDVGGISRKTVSYLNIVGIYRCLGSI